MRKYYTAKFLEKRVTNKLIVLGGPWANIAEGWANPSVGYAPVCFIRIIN